jgi:hypothetical protein
MEGSIFSTDRGRTLIRAAKAVFQVELAQKVQTTTITCESERPMRDPDAFKNTL